MITRGRRKKQWKKGKFHQKVCEQRNWVCVTISFILILISFHPNNIHSVTLKNLSLKYQSSTPSGCKDIGIRKFEFVAKTQFLLSGKFLRNMDEIKKTNIFRLQKIQKKDKSCLNASPLFHVVRHHNVKKS